MADFALKFTVDGKETSPLALAFQGRLMDVIAAKEARLEQAYPRAMARGVTQPGKSKLRATVEATGFYRASALAKTWRASTYPPGQPTLEPAAFFKSRLRLIVDAFEDGVTINAHGGKFLAVPEGPAKAIIHGLNRARSKSGVFKNEPDPVARVSAALGTPLIPLIDQRRGVGTLVAANSLTLTRGGHMAKRQTGRPTPLFALVRSATLKPRPMGREVLRSLQASFVTDFTGALATELGGTDD